MDPQVRPFLFVLFLLIYLVTLTGNLLIITQDARLQTPMYFFLVNLSFVDICLSSTIVPNMLVQLIHMTTLSFAGCSAQVYVYLILGCTECILLALMAFDRYVAIVFSLRYRTIMSRSNCITIAVICWISASMLALLDTVFTMRVLYCGLKIINHFFCKATALLRVACLDTSATEIVIIFVGYTALLIPCIFVLITYIHIIATIGKIRSSEARFKVFSTCASHLTVVTILYSTAIYSHMNPVSKESAIQTKLIAVFYSVIPPMTLIYSLRNKDVKIALKKLTLRNIFQ